MELNQFLRTVKDRANQQLLVIKDRPKQRINSDVIAGLIGAETERYRKWESMSRPSIPRELKDIDAIRELFDIEKLENIPEEAVEVSAYKLVKRFLKGYAEPRVSARSAITIASTIKEVDETYNALEQQYPEGRIQELSPTDTTYVEIIATLNALIRRENKRNKPKK